MSVLSAFAPPGNLTELSESARQSWSELLAIEFEGFAAELPQFYNPLVAETPTDHSVATVSWNAFPATLLQAATSSEGRWAAADASRDAQDEYCEWSVSRDDDGNVVAITFTTETPEYFEHLAIAEPQLFLDRYSSLVGREVALEELQDVDGHYNPQNPLNMSTQGPIVHLGQETNTLRAAIRLAAEATVLRMAPNGTPVVNQQELVKCGGLGEPARNSDPQIASRVNNLVAQGFEITLADPPGLYISELITGDIETPDGTDPREFWHVERGTTDFVLRARFQVPDGLDYKVSAVKLEGRPIRFGAQIADRVRVKLTAIAKPASFDITRQPCVPQPAP